VTPEIHCFSAAIENFNRLLMVSAEATMDKVSEAIKKGAAGFVVKPLNPASVLDRIASCIKEKGKE